MKELFMQAHDELIVEYLEAHPDATEAEAYKATANDAYHRMHEKFAAKVDAAYDRIKDAQYER